MTFLLSGLGLKLIGSLLGLMAAVGVILKIRSSGRDAQRAEDAGNALANANKAGEVAGEVAREPDSAVLDDLRRQSRINK